jgi:hypothetical protein
MTPITLKGIASADLARQVATALKPLADGRKVVEIVIRKPRTQRSLDQNAYWWAVPVKILAEFCGYTENQMHYALLGECFGYEPGPHGVPVPVKPSSADLSVEEFTHLIDWAQQWAASELGVDVPGPDEARAAA